jgi:hypothetical protein
MILFASFAACLAGKAGPIDVTYSVSGAPGAWNLDFTVVNNLTAWPNQDIYQFGVKLSAPGVTASPAGYDPTVFSSVTNLFNGGKPIFYNNIWVDFFDLNHLLPGSSLSGFSVQIADASPPASVDWFAFSYSSTFDPFDVYDGPDAFNVDPSFGAGFEGVAAGEVPPPSTAPEPATFGVVAAALATGAFLKVKLQRA